MSARKFSPLLGLALLAVALIAPAAAQAGFGVKALSVEALNQGGSPDLQAGSHPDQFRLAFEMNQTSEGEPEGTLRELRVDLPPGMVGNPLAVPRCSAADFEGPVPPCPGDSQVGLVTVRLFGGEGNPSSVFQFPVYNLTPPLGVPASFGTSIVGINSFQEASLRSEDYGVAVSDLTIPTSLPFQSIEETIWGVPAFGNQPGKGHFDDRFCINSEGEKVRGCASNAPTVPFLTLPTSCQAPLKWTLTVGSVEEPTAPQSASAESLGPGGVPRGLSGCDELPFNPTIAARPETAAADSPTGVHVNLDIPQSNAPVPPEIGASAHLKDTMVTLPQGLALNSSAADGRAGCPLTGPQGINLPGSGEPAQGEAAKCPDNSKVGTVEVRTPLVDHPLPGSVYLARQGENPFGSLIALYIAINDPQSGIVVKLAGKVEPNPITGQLTATFRDNPQVPFEDFSLDFFGGPRATLTTPSTCGTYTTTSDLTPWTTPQGRDAFPTDTFPISSGASGAPCAASEAQLPNAPGFEAGTVSPLAGSYSPFVIKLTRENGSQRFGALNLTMPPGLTGKLAGLDECSNAQIAAATARSAPGQGALEQSSPSCPRSSEVGTATVGAGSGNPLYVQGHVYLAGPYRGAPLSLAVITPAVAGPFDLGAVVVRAALYVDPETAQITAKTDPLPTILQGVPLDIRSVAVNVNRDNFTLNPTSCEQMKVTGQEISSTGAVAPLANRFQVGGCNGLNFTPKLALSLKGPTKRTGHATLKAVLTAPKGQANIGRVSVVLPKSQFIDQDHINNTCTRPQFAENKCPAKSILGHARAFTPLLDKPLEGPVYFRANGGERELPDLVADLNGQIHVVVVGFNDHVSKKGSEISRIRNTFAAVPDAPVSKFVLELNGGKKKGLIENSENLCSRPQKAEVKMRGQNGKTHDFAQTITTGCGKK